MNWKDLQDEKLENLIEFVQLRGDEESISWSQSAFIVITFRYRKELLERCTKMCTKNGLTETDAEEIANRVFEKFYHYPTFKVSKCTVKDVHKCFRLYLFAIARNEFVDYVTPDESPYTGEEHVITSLINPDQNYTPEKLKELQEAERKLDKIFSRLTTKHKIIYLTYQYYQHEGKYLPKRLRQELKDLLKISQSSIRVYKKEAFELIESLKYGN